jgi:Vacuolar protein sorting-associated protein
MCVLNFAGDVVLQDLVLKQSALDDLALPVKTIFGTLGTQSLYNLCIKIMNFFILIYSLYCKTCQPYLWRREKLNGCHSASEISKLYLE